ncbi:MAG TPA: EAL domain-containing protein [Woeseiaceae bacterium]|nr:EAL domain-containing protein [Woeseiaceae bacterium]
MPNKPNLRTVPAEEQDLRARLEKAEDSLREILSGESDAVFIEGAGGAQLFAVKGADQSYRTLIENMSEGALILTPEGLILYANRRFAEMLGTPLEKVIGSEIHRWFAPEGRGVLQTLLRKDASDRRREELALTAADGTQVPVNLSVSHLKLEGAPASFCMVATDLTQQKHNEAILAAESLARAILEQAADAIVVCDETGRVIRASRQAQAFCGNNPVGQHFEHAFPLRQPGGTTFSTIGDFGTNPRQSVEARLERDGQGFDLLVSVGHLKGAGTGFVGSVVTLTDVTERVRAERALLESGQRYRMLFESMDEGFCIAEMLNDPDGKAVDYRFVEINPAFEKHTGLHQAVGKTARQLVPGNDAHWFDIYGKVARTGEAIRFESPADAMHRFFDVFAFRIGGDGSRNVGILFRDITARKHSDTALRESELRYHSLFENMLEGYAYCRTIFEQDRLSDFIYLEANGAFGRLTGLQDVVGKKVSDVVPGVQKDNPELFEIYEQVALTGQPKKFETYMPALSRWLAITVYSSDREHFVAVFENITDRKNSEARILYLNRVYAMLGGINTLIRRVHDRDELFREACRIAVEAGGFRMVMIAILDRSTMNIVPVASAGMDAELKTAIKGLLSSSEGASKTMIARAIRGKKPVVSNDSLNDPQNLLGKQHGEGGVRSVAVLPLVVSDEAVGVLALYAGEVEFFHEEEMKVLTELASDIAFAIDHIEKGDKLSYLAYYDPLTGLANRSLFLERMAQHLRSAAGGRHKLAVFLIDLERFKNINDSLGRPAGDALLLQVAQWLTRNSGDAKLLARVGPDHFAAVLPEVRQDGDIAQLLEQWMKAFLDHPFRLKDAVFRIAIKVGVALYPDDGADAETLFRNAEAALKKAKAGGDRYLFHMQNMTEAVAVKLTLENQLREAFDREEFVLHYQPKVNLVSGKLTGAEALIRWNDPRTGLVPPGRFIPILEETGLIFEVGRWALRKALEDYLRWRNAGLAAVRVAVNVSPLQLRNRGFIAEIQQAIGTDAQAAAGLELEITESLIMENVRHSTASLQAIRALGVTIAIDDFGTGFSSLAYLAKLPVDTLKIDRSFVTDMTVGPEGLALVSTMINLAHSLKLKVVAEGVETEEQSRLLRLLDCDEMQGFLFSKPVPREIFETRFLKLLPHPSG